MNPCPDVCADQEAESSFGLALESGPPVGASEGLAEQLAAEMARRWRAGERPLAEEFLAGAPELRDRPAGAVRLIYEEICLRKEFGPKEGASVEVLRRFPQWRAELEVLLDCHRLLQAAPADPVFPGVGEVLGDFRLRAELGRGGQGRVFLATQPALADRPVVLKLTPCDGHEHLSLARLQHTHIVPLYWVWQDAARNLRALCLPYFGSVTLAQALEALRPKPPAERTGSDLLAVIDRAQAAAPVALPVEGPARQFLAQASYVRAVCGLGVCLAEALHYAHERGLVHLDVKPSNVLLAADGQPMLLDFHLAQEPILPDGPAPWWLGGTAAYLSPEQQAALTAVRDGQPIRTPVDGRSDIYSLGLLLYEALGGSLPPRDRAVVPLSALNPQVSVGLADVVAKCLAPQAADRYPRADALAADLRRHLENQPLQGVANRSLAERWHKWHSRRRYALTWCRRLVLVLVGALAAGAGLTYVGRLREEAKAALADGQQRLHRQDFPGAVQTLTRGLTLIEYLPGSHDLKQALDDGVRQARRAQAVHDLHQLVDQLRFLLGADFPNPGPLESLERQCRQVWSARAWLAQSAEAEGATEQGGQVRLDLLDLAVCWVDLRVRLAPPVERRVAQAEALRTLREAEDRFGPSALLYREQERYARAVGQEDLAREAGRHAAERPPQTAWDHYTLGRSLLHAGAYARAAAAFDRAVELRPQDFWPHFYQGVCAFHLKRFDAAVAAFRVCIALKPQTAEGYYNRALAYAASGQAEVALRDYRRVLELNPGLAASLHRRIGQSQPGRDPPRARKTENGPS